MPSADSDSPFFPASYDATTQIVSTVVCAIVLTLAAVSHSAITGGVGALLLVFSYAFSPRGYTIREGSIIVRRLIGNVSISLDGVREARAATADDLRGCIRLWGDGGLFGYYGLFRTAKLGKSTWYVSNRAHRVVVVTSAKTVVLSPDDVELFLAAVRTSTPLPPDVPGGPSPDSPSRTAAIRIGRYAGVVIGVAAIAAVVLAMLYSPGRPSYTLTPESLTIHDRFYPVTVQAASVEVERVRVVNIETDADWRPVSRVNGFANSHYRSGWFRVSNGQNARMYWADGTRLILLPPKGNGVSVLLEVNQPEQFLRELRQEWLGQNG